MSCDFIVHREISPVRQQYVYAGLQFFHFHIFHLQNCSNISVLLLNLLKYCNKPGGYLRGLHIFKLYILYIYCMALYPGSTKCVISNTALTLLFVLIYSKVNNLRDQMEDLRKRNQNSQISNEKNIHLQRQVSFLTSPKIALYSFIFPLLIILKMCHCFMSVCTYVNQTCKFHNPYSSKQLLFSLFFCFSLIKSL